MELSNNKNPSYAIWHKKNGQKYLEVKASNHYQLGFIQGNYLFKKIFELKEIIHLIALKYIPKNFSYKKFKKMAKLYEKFIPKNFQLEMKGVADAIRGISYGDILLQNCFFDIFYGHLIPNDKHNPIFDSYEMGCTSFGALNQNNPLIGQNFDLPIIFKPTLSFVLVKMPQKPDIFTLRMGSILSLPVGVNSYGVCVTVNVVKSYVKGNYSIPISIKSRLAFEKSRDAESFYKFQISVPSSASCNLLISDNSKIIALENLPIKHVHKDVKDIVVKSNTFNVDSFQKYLVQKDYSKKRQRYAEIRLKKLYNDNLLTDKELLNLLSEEPIICRLNPNDAMTIAFFTSKNFGIGNAKHHKPGINPLSL